MAIIHTIRTKDGRETIEGYTMKRAIRKMCIECMGWSLYAPEECTSPLCPLFPYRTGKPMFKRAKKEKSNVDD